VIGSKNSQRADCAEKQRLQKNAGSHVTYSSSRPITAADCGIIARRANGGRFRREARGTRCPYEFDAPSVAKLSRIDLLVIDDRAMAPL